MKGIVIYDTSHGNTKAIGEAISEGLEQSGMAVEVFYVKDVKKLNAGDYDFLILGSPTKFGTMSFTVKGFMGKIKPEDWINKPFAAFDTENPENIEKHQGSAAEKIANLLKEKQMNQMLPPFMGVVFDWKGPLKEGEVERAKDYGRKLAVELKKIPSKSFAASRSWSGITYHVLNPFRPGR